MRCPKCGMAFANRSAVCPRCGSDINKSNAASAFFNRTLFYVADYPISFLQLYAVVAVNLVIACVIINASTYASFGVLWSVPAALAFPTLYSLMLLIGADRRKFMPRFRRTVWCALLFAAALQLFVTDGSWAIEWFFPSLMLLSYLTVVALSLAVKRNLNQKYVTLLSMSAIGILPFIIVECGFGSGGAAAYYFVFAQFVVSLFFFLNAAFVGILKLKKSIGSILE